MEQDMEQDSMQQAGDQAPTDNEMSMPVSHMPVSSGNSGFHQPPATQILPEMMGPYIASAEEFRCNGGEWESQYLRSLPEQGAGRPSQLTPTPSQDYCQRPTVCSGTLGVTASFSENPMSHGGLPSLASCGVSMMAHSSAPTVSYSVPPTAPATTGSLNHGILLVPGMLSTGTHTVTSSMDPMLHSVDTYNPEIALARFQQLLSLDPQDSPVTQSNVQEEPFVYEQPTPPQEKASPSTSSETTRRRRLFSKPFICLFGNCRKAYTKRSHLRSHQLKHTGQKPYECDWKNCHWTFSHADELGRHKLVHIRHRPYECDECNRKFKRSDHLKQHKKTHLPGRDFLQPYANSEQTDGTDGPLPPDQELFSSLSCSF